MSKNNLIRGMETRRFADATLQTFTIKYKGNSSVGNIKVIIRNDVGDKQFLQHTDFTSYNDGMSQTFQVNGPNGGGPTQINFSTSALSTWNNPNPEEITMQIQGDNGGDALNAYISWDLIQFPDILT